MKRTNHFGLLLAVPLGIGLLLGCSSDSDGSTQSQMSELEPGTGGPMTGPGDDSSSEDSTADGSGEDEPAFGGDDPTNEDDTPDAGDGPSIDPPCPGCRQPLSLRIILSTRRTCFT
jgi:hypothetical protein